MFNFKREGINFNEVEQSLYAWARENGYSNHDVIAMLASTVCLAVIDDVFGVEKLVLTSALESIVKFIWRSAG